MLRTLPNTPIFPSLNNGKLLPFIICRVGEFGNGFFQMVVQAFHRQEGRKYRNWMSA